MHRGNLINFLRKIALGLRVIHDTNNWPSILMVAADTGLMKPRPQYKPNRRRPLQHQSAEQRKKPTRTRLGQILLTAITSIGTIRMRPWVPTTSPALPINPRKKMYLSIQEIKVKQTKKR